MVVSNPHVMTGRYSRHSHNLWERPSNRVSMHIRVSAKKGFELRSPSQPTLFARMSRADEGGNVRDVGYFPPNRSVMPATAVSG